MSGLISFLFFTMLMSIDLTNAEKYNPNAKTTTTKGYPTTPTTTMSSTQPAPICPGPNMTLANSGGCHCQPTCGFGLACPSNCYTYFKMFPNCVCAEEYVRDPLNFDRCIHASECQCKGPNEEFRTCAGGNGPNCAYPDRNYTRYCDASTSRCVCKEGYLRNANWACVPKNSPECVMENIITTTPLPTERIHCYNGTFFVANCSWYTDSNNSADYKKCMEYQKQRENDAFHPILCDQGVTRCYDLRHDCYLSDGSKHVKGCDDTDSSSGFCGQFRYEQCFRWISDKYSCNACEGNLCNKGNNTKTTYSTPSIRPTTIITTTILSTTQPNEDYSTTTTITTTSTTPPPPPTCHGPNTTLGTNACNCQPVCDFGTICSSKCQFVTDTFGNEPLKCACAQEYVLDRHNLSRCIHASECQCKAPNEEFRTCIECEPTCARPNYNCPKNCDSTYNSRCVCREGYLRNEMGVCIPKNSQECAMEATTTTPHTTTINYRERINCYNGSIFVADCSWYANKNSKDYKKCVEYQKQRENDAFHLILCDQGVTQCYDVRHNCYVSDATKHVKGCGSIRSTQTYGICNELVYGQCGGGGDTSKYRCGTCEGNLCNKNDIPYTTTTTKTYSSSTTSYSSTNTTTYSSTPMMTNQSTTTKATTKVYHG